jgi:hypothetical protein
MIIMNASGYLCSICLKKYTRKWNAQRHNNDIHKGLAIIDYQLQNGNLTFNKQTNTLLNYSATFKFNEKQNIFKNNNDISTFKPFNKIYQNKSRTSILFMNEKEKENYLYYILEQMSVPFEKLEKLLIEKPSLIAPNIVIESFLSTMIIKALGMPDPVKTVHDNLAYYTRLHRRNKMISSVVTSEMMDVLSPIEYLKGILFNRVNRKF